MKSVRIHEHGDSGVLNWEDVPEPTIKPGHVVVQIKSSSLNHLDIWVRKGIPGVPLPLTTGSDAAGVIKDVGDNVHDLKMGDPVLIQPLFYCGSCDACNRGEENLCVQMGIMGENSQGVNSEYLMVPAAQVYPIKTDLSFTEAASIALVGQTSFQMIVNRAKLRLGETILIWGASSGVGSAGIQIAKSLGASVIAIAGTHEKCEKAKSLGADDVLNYKRDDILADVKSITNGRGVNVVFEHVGAASWDMSMKTLARGGRVVTCGATTGFNANLNLTHIFFKQQSILGSTMGSKSAFEGAMGLVNKGELKPVVDRIFPIQEIAPAHDYLASGEQFGKVVLSYE